MARSASELSTRSYTYYFKHKLGVSTHRVSEYRINFKTVNIIFRTLQSSQPVYLRSILHTHHSTRSLRLSNTNLLCAPFVRTSFGSRSFSVAAPKIWNSLPPGLRMCTSHDTFRHQLKTHYFQQAFQPTYCLFSCASDSALADHCARSQIIFTYLLTYQFHTEAKQSCCTKYLKSMYKLIREL